MLDIKNMLERVKLVLTEYCFKPRLIAGIGQGC